MDVVVVGGGPWSVDTNFPTHHTARLLARDHRVLYLYRDSHASLLGHAAGRLPGFHTTRELLRHVVARPVAPEVQPNLWVSPLAGVSAALPLSYPPLSRGLTSHFVIRHLQAALRQLGFDNPLLWFYWWFFPEIARAVPHILALYDIYDDHSEYDFVRSNAHRKRYTLQKERELLDACDLAFAVSRTIQEQRKGSTPVHYLPNGVDLDRIRPAMHADLPADIARLPHPIVGYLGSFDSRMNWDLVFQMAACRPTWSFAFVGGGYRPPPRVAPNMHMLGNREYSEALRYVHGFDVALIPFVHDALTDAICPAKLFDYLALGKPILSTAIPAVRDVAGGPPVAYFGETPEEFVRNADLALREDTSARDKREELAARFTWQHRMDEAMIHIQAALARRTGAA